MLTPWTHPECVRLCAMYIFQWRHWKTRNLISGFVHFHGRFCARESSHHVHTGLRCSLCCCCFYQAEKKNCFLFYLLQRVSFFFSLNANVNFNLKKEKSFFSGGFGLLQCFGESADRRSNHPNKSVGHQNKRKCTTEWKAKPPVCPQKQTHKQPPPCPSPLRKHKMVILLCVKRSPDQWITLNIY